MKIIPIKNTNADFENNQIKIKFIDYYPSHGELTNDEITEEIVQEILKSIPSGINVLLSTDEYGEENFLEVISDGEWLALGYFYDEAQYVRYSYNSLFDGSNELSPLFSGGQTPIEKCFTVQDKEAGIKAVEYFIRTGELYPCIQWAEPEE